jgi:hypothetical protein
VSEASPLIPYSVGEPAGWAEVVSSWPWQRQTSKDGTIVGWRKEGDCPNCGGRTPIELGLIVTIDIVQGDNHLVYAECHCSATHETGKVGCGAGAMIKGPA